MVALKCPWRAIYTVLGYSLPGAMRVCAMRVWKYSSILRELLKSVSATILIALTVSVFAARPVAAHAPAADDGTVAAVAAEEDPADNIDRPAPSADYDKPADVAASAPDADVEPDDATDEQVLELPQVIDPASYATVSYAPASHVPAVAPSSAGDADGSADLPDAVVSNRPSDGQDDPDGEAAQSNPDGDAAQSNPAGDADDVQSYADQGNDGGGGPVVVYAAPAYVPMYPVTTQANALPQPYTGLPMYSALSYRTLPMYSGLAPVTPGRYYVPGGSRLWNSPIGQGFGMARGSMIGGFSHVR